MPSIGVVANAYNEANAISGWLESANQFFDDILVYHTGPGGAYSHDGTIEIVQKWGARLEFGSIDEGFGVVRTKAVSLSNCEWVMILDADERFHARAPLLHCGENLQVQECGEPYNQGAWLRSILEDASIDAVCTMRRHWHDFTWKRPTENWMVRKDYQLRIVRNNGHIGYREYPKMHEHCFDNRTGENPTHFRPTMQHGPFHDHYHCWYKVMETEQRAHDVAIYDALHEDRDVPTWEAFALGEGQQFPMCRWMAGNGWPMMEKLARSEEQSK